MVWIQAAPVMAIAGSPRQRMVISFHRVDSGLNLSAGYLTMPPRAKVTLLPVSGEMMTGRLPPVKMDWPMLAMLFGQYLAAVAAVYMPAGVKLTVATLDLRRSPILP